MTLGGYFEVTAKLSNVRGTTFDMFTIHGDQSSLGWQDLQALKIASLGPTRTYLLNMDPRYAACAVHVPASLLTHNCFSTGAVSRASPSLTSDSSQGFHTVSFVKDPLFKPFLRPVTSTLFPGCQLYRVLPSTNPGRLPHTASMARIFQVLYPVFLRTPRSLSSLILPMATLHSLPDRRRRIQC